MSDENKNHFQYDPFFYEDDRGSGRGIDETTFPYHNIMAAADDDDPPQSLLQGLMNPFSSSSSSSYMNFTDCLRGSMDYSALSRAFDMSCSSSSTEVVLSPTDPDGFEKGGSSSGAGENPPTPPRSSLSSSSTEAAPEAGEDDEDVKPNKVRNQARKNKREKMQKVPRFAFMTKSEIDHLEDGYRWRKYGQKAVKNSSYPRSYYKCTTQKCTVKKRIERSFEDPSVVITTYEGQHSHQCPATLRGSAAATMFSSPLFSSSASSVLAGGSSFTKELLMLPTSSESIRSSTAGLPYYQGLAQQQAGQLHDYGLLQDMLPNFIHKQERP